LPLYHIWAISSNVGSISMHGYMRGGGSVPLGGDEQERLWVFDGMKFVEQPSTALACL